MKSENERLRHELARRIFSTTTRISPTPLELELIFQEWESFEFVTKKKGASGPTKTECLSYYAEKYVKYYCVKVNYILYILHYDD